MNQSRRSKLALVLLLTVAAALTVGTAGFSSIVADRPVSVTVVSDQSAYVGFNTTDRTISGPDGGTDELNIRLVTVTNRLSNPLKIQKMSVDVDNSSIHLKNPRVLDENDMGETATIPPGESVVVTAPVESCPVGTSSAVEVGIETNSTGVQAVLNDGTDTARFTMTCPSIESVEFDGEASNGAGNAKINPDGLTVGVTLQLSNGETTGCKVDTSKKVRSQCLSNDENGNQITTVVINATNKEYQRDSDL